MGKDQKPLQEEIVRKLNDLRAYTERLAREEMRSRALIQGLQATARPRSEAVPGAGEPTNDIQPMAGQPMNWAHRLGVWLDAKRVVHRAEFDLFKHNIHKILEEDRKTSVAKDVADLKVRMDRLELYVGLKREPKPVVVPGEARIS